MPRTRSTMRAILDQNDTKFSEEDSDGIIDMSLTNAHCEHESRILNVAHNIASSDNPEEKSMLLARFKRLLDANQVLLCEMETKGLGCHHNLKESIACPFIVDMSKLNDLLGVLALLLESSLKSGIQDSQQVLTLLKSIACTDLGSSLISENSQILSWLFDKLDKQKLLENNRDSGIMELILGLLQKLSKTYKVQIFDGWLNNVVRTIKEVLLQDLDFNSSQHHLVLLDIFLNILTSNKQRLPLIQDRDLKKILAHISEVKGAAKMEEIRLMTARLQLLLTPFDLMVDDVELAPLSINRVISIIQKAVDKKDSPVLLARCIDFLGNIVSFAPSSLQRHEKHWLSLAEEFLTLSEEDKAIWYESLAEPLLQLLSAIHGDAEHLSMSRPAANVFCRWSTEVCSSVLTCVFKTSINNEVTNLVKDKAYFVLSKCLTSAEIWSHVNESARHEVLDTAAKDISAAADKKPILQSDQHFLISAALFIKTVGAFDDKFNRSLSRSLFEKSPLQFRGHESGQLLLANILLSAHLAEDFPDLWKAKVQAFLEEDKVCVQLANILTMASHEVYLDVITIVVQLLSEKGKSKLHKYLKPVNRENCEAFAPLELSSSNPRRTEVAQKTNKRDIVAEYEMKMRVLEEEVKQCQKSYSSTQELLEFYMSKNNLMEEERKRLVKRNLEEFAENNNMLVELQRKEHKIDDLLNCVSKLKKITDSVKVDLELKAKAVVQAEKDLLDCQTKFESVIEQEKQEKAELKKTVAGQEQKITKYRQLAHDNKLEMAKRDEVMAKKEDMLKTLKEENQEMMVELDELRKFKHNILNITSKAANK